MIQKTRLAGGISGTASGAELIIKRRPGQDLLLPTHKYQD